MPINHRDDEIDLGGVEELTKGLEGVNAKTVQKEGSVDIPESEVKEPTEDLESHRTASELDHPRGSIRMKHFDRQTRDAIQRVLESLAQGNAEDIALEDSAGRYTATDIEAALAEIAGAGRTTETVKDNADDIATNTSDITANANDIASHRDVHTVTSANYTILDDDDYAVILVTTGAVDRTITLPTATDNSDRQIKILKVDSGVGKVIVDGEGAETVNGTATWEITQQYGYVALVCNGAGWFVVEQEGSVYEMWDASDYMLTTSWVDYYNLADVPAGRYFIEFGIELLVNNTYAYATIATAVDTEDDQKYTVAVRAETTITVAGLLSKTFYRAFSGVTTLYLNSKESAGADGRIQHSTAGAKGYIRATRIG